MWLIEKLPRVLPGVIVSAVSICGAPWFGFVGTPPKYNCRRSRGALDSLGYPPHPAQDVRSREIRRQEEHRFLIRIGVAAACTGNVMTLAFALYGGAFSGIEAVFAALPLVEHVVCDGFPRLARQSVLPRCVGGSTNQDVQLDLPITLALAGGGMAGTITPYWTAARSISTPSRCSFFSCWWGVGCSVASSIRQTMRRNSFFHSRQRWPAVWTENGSKKSQSTRCGRAMSWRFSRAIRFPSMGSFSQETLPWIARC